MTPPAPWMGSAMNAATFCAPRYSISRSRMSAQIRPSSSPSSFQGLRYGKGLSTCEQPGTIGSKGLP